MATKKTQAAGYSTVSFKADPQLRAWLASQAADAGMSVSAVVRWYLERARGDDPRASYIKQLVTANQGALRSRVAIAMKAANHAMAEALTDAMMAPTDQAQEEIDAFNSDGDVVQDEDGAWVRPHKQDRFKDDPLGPPKKKKRRRGKRGSRKPK